MPKALASVLAVTGAGLRPSYRDGRRVPFTTYACY